MEEIVLKRTNKLETVNELLNLELSDHQNTEHELKKLIKELKISNQELERFAYVSSHDLKEPLRMITSFLQLLKQRYYDNLDQDANDFIDFAVEGALRMDMMINDLLKFSRVGNKREFNQVNCENVINNIIKDLSTLIEETNTSIIIDPLPVITANKTLMSQLFKNLIENAIKYQSKEDPLINISATEENGNYLFSVTDNGIGIEEQHLNKIFTIFQRLHTREDYNGTGIGLAISKKIIKQHYGEIWAESEPGKGTTFLFTIPK